MKKLTLVWLLILFSTVSYAWQIDFTNTLDIYEDTYMVGTRSTASDNFDSTDILQPDPTTNQYIQMKSVMDGHDLTGDFRKELEIGENKTWEIILNAFDATSSGLEGWNDLEWTHDVPDDITLTLIDYGPDNTKTTIYDQFNLKDYYAYEFYVDYALGPYTYFDLVAQRMSEPQFNINLNKGWNLFSIPLQPENNSVEEVLRNIPYSELFAYDFEWYTPSNIELQQGYWIKLDSAATLTVQGTELEEANYNLYDGWNLIGWPHMDTQSIPASFVNDSIMTYDGNWYSYNPIKQFNSLTTFQPGHAYWVKIQ